MLWAIDVGNTHTVVGRWDGTQWRRSWRLPTNASSTEDELASTLSSLCTLEGETFSAAGVVIGSVVPAFNDSLDRLCAKWLHTAPVYLRGGAAVGLPVQYSPPEAVGADRIANTLGALAMGPGPWIIVDFGSATTFDLVSGAGEYLGGAILPGPLLGLKALFSNTAKLPQVELKKPQSVIGKTTPEAMQIGVVLGYAEAIDGLCRRFQAELVGDSTVISTGGIGETFQSICTTIHRHEPNLTLDGLRIAYDRLRA